jgi:hypothetical protein
MSISRPAALCARCIALISGILLLAPGPGLAQDPPNRFALIRIENSTADLTIRYQFRWGKNAEWDKVVALAPGKAWLHWYTYEKENQNHSPTPQIMFKTGLNGGGALRTIELEAFATPSNEQGGKLYQFEQQKDASGQPFFALVAVNSAAKKEQRQQALAALDAFWLGSTLSPRLLADINSLPAMEPIDKPTTSLSPDAKKFILAEQTRLAALEFEMVAAADLLFRASRFTPAERLARGLKLSWLLGPVTAPNARGESKDGLGGLRVIGRLDLPEGKQIHAIFAFCFYAPPQDSNEEGRIGFLSDVDNFRLEVRFFNTDSVKNDFAHQSFRVADGGNKVSMRPGFYVDPKTGMLASKQLVFTALGTSCINCHLHGPKLKPAQLEVMEKGDFAAMEGFTPFLDQMKHWGAGKIMRQKTEALLRSQGPAALLPLSAMLEANREHWISIYPSYLARSKTPLSRGSDEPGVGDTWLTGTTWMGTESLDRFGKLSFEFRQDGSAIMIDAKSTERGTWTRQGTTVVIAINNCSYTGELEDQRISGSAEFTNGQPTDRKWTFELSRK